MPPRRDIFRDRDSGPWYAFRYSGGRWRRKSTGCTSAAAAKSKAQKWRDEGDLIIGGVLKEQDRAAVDPLEKQIAAYVAWMKSRPNAAGIRHIAAVKATLRAYAVGCKWLRLTDITESSAHAFADLRTVGKKKKAAQAARTKNLALSMLRTFCKWCVENDRLRANPFGRLRRFAGDDKIQRRGLTAVEIQKLLDAALTRPCKSMTGESRRMLYIAALATGFRAQELAVLTPANFFQSDDGPAVWVDGENTKNGNDVEQPLLPEFGAEIMKWVASKPVGEPLWRVGPSMARIVRRDLAAAGIAYEVDGQRFDFHALRGQYVSALIDAGVPILQVADLARHADINTTRKHYRRLTLTKSAGAIKGVRMLPEPVANQKEIA